MKIISFVFISCFKIFKCTSAFIGGHFEFCDFWSIGEILTWPYISNYLLYTEHALCQFLCFYHKRHNFSHTRSTIINATFTTNFRSPTVNFRPARGGTSERVSNARRQGHRSIMSFILEAFPRTTKFDLSEQSAGNRFRKH